VVTPRTIRSPIARWALDPAIVHLNHGSFGGCPRAVVAAAADLRVRIEAAPMRFFVLDWQSELDRARAVLASFLAVPARRLVFASSATTAVAIALRSLAGSLQAGDEVLITDHAYRACRNQLVRIARSRGARLIDITIKLPFDPDQLVEAVAAAITPRTRLALLDHVTSPTALVLPVERLVPLLAARGIATVIDGAHAPGQIELAIEQLGASFYAGNCHKWLCAPKGSGFLVAGEGVPVEPLVTSHGASPEYGGGNRLHAELDWAGTYDPAPHLVVPVALETIAVEAGRSDLAAGWAAVRERNHLLAVEMGRRLRDGLGSPRALAPEAALGAMVAVEISLPPGVAPLELERQLLASGWEVPIVASPVGPLVRISAHLYNDAAEADRLVRELHARGVRAR
jgi:isopenicillin-N epimerase